MPYSADLRCSYFKLNFNISWFHQLMEDHGMDVCFPTHNRPTPETTEEEDKHLEYVIREFEEYIEECFSDYIKHTVFMPDWPGSKMFKRYDSVWEYVWEKAQEYTEEHPEVVFVKN